jgi:predicted DsbA family dithiol-disulfide isomerase
MWDAAEAAFRAYFTDGRDLADDAVLAEIGAAAGLSGEGVRAARAPDAFAADFAEAEEIARAIGISGVPFYVFDGRYAVSGAQPPEAFLQVIERVRSEAAGEAAGEADAAD